MEPAPRHIDLDRAHGLRLTWADGSESFFPIAYLRHMSPSADQRQRRAEQASNPLAVIPATSAPGSALRATSAQVVGNYALRIAFSDGHSTGLYTWDYLRAIDPDNPAPQAPEPPIDPHLSPLGLPPPRAHP